MVTKFHNGRIYLGNNHYSSECYVGDAGIITTQRAFYEADIREEVDLEGNLLVPAFRDAHAHPLFAGRESLGADITGVSNIEQIGQILQSYMADNPSTSWLDGASYDRSLTEAKTRQALDNFVSHIPVVLHAEDHHTLWVNTKALEVAGLFTRNLPDLTEGGIDVGEDGLPTGILREWQAMQMVLSKAPKLSLEQDIQALVKAEDLMLAAGIVEVQDAWIERGMAEVYLSAASRLKLDYKLAFRVDAKSFEDDFTYASEMMPMFDGLSNVKVQAIKFFVDGVFGSATAAVIEPYLSSNGHGDLNWSQDSLIAAINKTHQAGLQTHIHAIGDKGVDFALDAIAEAERGFYKPVIAHAELTNLEIIAKAKTIGVILCMQPFWAQYNGMLNSCSVHLGEKRLNSLYAIHDMLAAGVNVAFSSDWPVSSYRPLDGITVAMHRRSSTNQQPHNPSQAISLEQALDAYSNSVCSMFGNSFSGTLDVGQPFDAALVDRDLRQQDLDGLLATEILAVYVAGAKLFPHH